MLIYIMALTIIFVSTSVKMSVKHILYMFGAMSLVSMFQIIIPIPSIINIILYSIISFGFILIKVFDFIKFKKISKETIIIPMIALVVIMFKNNSIYGGDNIWYVSFIEKYYNNFLSASVNPLNNDVGIITLYSGMFAINFLAFLNTFMLNGLELFTFFMPMVMYSLIALIVIDCCNRLKIKKLYILIICFSLLVSWGDPKSTIIYAPLIIYMVFLTDVKTKIFNALVITSCWSVSWMGGIILYPLHKEKWLLWISGTYGTIQSFFVIGIISILIIPILIIFDKIVHNLEIVNKYVKKYWWLLVIILLAITFYVGFERWGYGFINIIIPIFASIILIVSSKNWKNLMFLSILLPASLLVVESFSIESISWRFSSVIAAYAILKWLTSINNIYIYRMAATISAVLIAMIIPSWKFSGNLFSYQYLNEEETSFIMEIDGDKNISICFGVRKLTSKINEARIYGNKTHANEYEIDGLLKCNINDETVEQIKRENNIDDLYLITGYDENILTSNIKLIKESSNGNYRMWEV